MASSSSGSSLSSSSASGSGKKSGKGSGKKSDKKSETGSGKSSYGLNNLFDEDKKSEKKSEKSSGKSSYGLNNLFDEDKKSGKKSEKGSGKSSSYGLVNLFDEDGSSASSSKRAKTESGSAKSLTAKEAAEVKKVSDASASFGTKIYPHLIEALGDDKNLIFCPYSVSATLDLALAGARSTTRTQMMKALSHPKDKEPNEGHKTIHDSLCEAESDDIHLNIANRLFLDKQYQVLEEYLETAKVHYDAEPQLVEFAKEKDAREEINEWVEKITKKQVSNAMKPGILKSDTSMVLVNAIYFKANWEKQFDPKETKKMAFEVSHNKSVNVNMMSIKDKFFTAYSKELEASILDKPYAGKRLSMWFILPDDPEGFKNMEKRIQKFDLTKVSFDKKAQTVEVKIPRFKITTTHSLGDSLKKLGMTDAFDKEKSDFSGISGTKDLHMSKVIQKAFIEVNEEGSTAAAATAENEREELTMVPKLKEFVCKHPFNYLIRDNTTEVNLFLGRFVDPSSEKPQEGQGC